MKTAKNIYPLIYDFGNLERAFFKARRCKRYSKDALKFSRHRQEQLGRLQDGLRAGTYKQGPYKTFVIHEPKERVISALPFYDRVAQHALNFIIEPYFERRYYYHSYACRKGKGSHRAAKQLQTWIYEQTYNGKKLYALKADIHHYFASIDHEILKALLRRIFADKESLALLDQIIDSTPGGKGLPVGNLTSQAFANLYLTELDNFVKRELKARFYIRYMDDFVILSDDPKELAAWLEAITRYLDESLALSLNPKTAILYCGNGVNFVGYRVYSDHMKLSKRSVRNMRRRIIAFRRGEITEERLDKAVTSWEDHAKHADTFHIHAAIMAEVAAAKAA